MDNTTDTRADEQAASVTRSDELVRHVQGRMLAGVSQGLASRFGIPVWLARLGFIATSFAGGIGIALYAAGWALIRSEDETETPAERFLAGADTRRSWLGISLIVIAALILIGSFSFISGEVLLAVGLLTFGVLLYTGHISPPRAPRPVDEVTHDKEGVQQVTSTDTVATPKDEAIGESPAGGFTAPPPTPTPTPPNLPPSPPKETSILGRLTIGVMLLGLGVLAILDNVEALAIDAHPRHYMAFAVTILGSGLLVGSVAGRARWLIILGAILVPTLIFSPAFEYDWNNEEFDFTARPTSFGALSPEYVQDIGRLEIDLTELPWAGQEVVLTADLDLGELVIRIPEGVGIFGYADINIGNVEGLGRSSSGLGEPHLEFDETGTLGTVVLDAHVDIGNLQIRR